MKGIWLLNIRLRVKEIKREKEIKMEMMEDHQNHTEVN